MEGVGESGGGGGEEVGVSLERVVWVFVLRI